MNTSLFKTSVFQTQEFSELGVPVRYIKSTINGSVDNLSNYITLLSAFDLYDNNMVYGKKIYCSSNCNAFNTIYKNITANTWSYSSILDEENNIGSNYYTFEGTGAQYVIADIGFITPIKYITVIHRFGTQYQYSTSLLEISTDNINWTTVYSGVSTGVIETSRHELVPSCINVRKNNQVFCKSIHEE